MPRRSSSVGFAEPMSSFLYSCIASADIISAFISRAADTDVAVFPLAVGPVIINSLCFIILSV